MFERITEVLVAEISVASKIREQSLDNFTHKTNKGLSENHSNHFFLYNNISYSGFPETVKNKCTEECKHNPKRIIEKKNRFSI